MASEELTVKYVDVFGDSIIAAQDKDGNIWAGVKCICAALGLSEGQTRNERRKIMEDLVLSKGRANLPHLPTNGGVQEVLCIQLDYMPLWLAKISITPAMKQDNPELVDKLIKYQLKAKDILADAFLPHRGAAAALPKDYPAALRAYADEVEKRMALEQKNADLQNETVKMSKTISEMKAKTDYLDIILQSKSTVCVTQIAQDYGMSAVAFNRILNQLGIQRKVGNQWILYAPYLRQGYVQSETVEITHSDGRADTVMHTKWLQKGRIFLYNLLKSNGYVPLIERSAKE